MRWPFVTRRRFDETAQHLGDLLTGAKIDATYWRTRAEKLIDFDLARRGAITEPTMRDVAPPKPSVAATMFSSMARTEFESVKRD